MIPEPPRPDSFIGINNLVTRNAQEWLTLIWLSANALQESGATANRPTVRLWVGRPYFDTTLGMPIWYDGTNWVDATGATV